MNKFKYIFTLLVLLSALNNYAQKDLSLSDAIEMGLSNNYDLQITRKSEQVASINNNLGNAGALPKIDFTLNGRENFNNNDNEDFRTQTITPEVSLNWVVFSGFSAKISKQKLEELEKQSQYNTSILVESTIQDIISAYNNCLLQKEILNVYKQLSSLSEDRYKRTQESKNLGASTTYESLQAKTSWLEDQSNFLQQKVTYENTIRTLNYILAAEDNELWNLTTPLSAITDNYKLDDLTSKLMANNHSLKNQYLSQSLLAKETALAKSKQYPTLSFNTGMRSNNTDNYYSGDTRDVSQNSIDSYVGLTLSFNIFNGGTAKRSVQIAKIQEESEGVKTQQIQHSLKNQLFQLYSTFNVQKAILELSNEKEAAAKLNLELSEAKLKSGAINSFNYRDVQMIYLNAAITKYRSMYNLIQSNTDLLRITGGIIQEYQ
ncbi:TolC family protein [Puteibacter caeruleilacunae]|nr:TolC family protein [Puteibacter caeruleilacunae]